MSHKEEYNQVLKKYYGHNELKDLQYEIIENCLNGNDTIGLLPTSYGKSICYQLPFQITKKNVIVVSPLISLMQDQMEDLKSKNIDAICLNSANKNREEEIAEIYNGKNKIIYVTPEFLLSRVDFIEKLSFTDAICLIAIDECHCISSWGNSFRSDYKKLDFIKDLVPEVPILALSATATLQVVGDIKTSLNLVNPKIVKHSVDRNNLYIEIQERNENTFDEKILYLLEKYKNEGRVLIYCKTVDDTDKLAEKIANHGFKCKSYHAQKTNKERTETQREFTENEINVIVATIAFGMGINIPDIRALIHYNCSSDIESYVQEIGRAGRDNKKSECHMFYTEKDFILNYMFLDAIKDPEVKKQKEINIDYLKKYVRTNQCRRKILLNYFGETLDEKCNNCDNCLNKTSEKDIGNNAYLVLGAIHSIDSRSSKGTYIKILLGSKEKGVLKYNNTAFYGKGKNHKAEVWKMVIELLISNGYLVEEKVKINTKTSKPFYVDVLKMTAKAIKWVLLEKINKNEKSLIVNVVDNNKAINIDMNENQEEKDALKVKEMFKEKKKKT
jgi:RecQ family ATP-dependent DNA helicase